MRVLIIGHSHIAAVVAAHSMRLKRRQIQNKLDFRFIALNGDQYKPLLVDGLTVNPTLLKEVSDCVSGGVDGCFLTIGGSWHIVLGLADHPVKFSLFPHDVSSGDGRQFVPLSLMRCAMTEYAKSDLTLLEMLGELLPKPLFFLEPPPPVPDDAHIMNVAGPYREKIDQYGIAPRKQRLLIWRVQSEIIQGVCNRTGISMVSVPADCVDSEGFLHPRSWHIDPVHANVIYGERVLQQIERLMELQNGNI